MSVTTHTWLNITQAKTRETRQKCRYYAHKYHKVLLHQATKPHLPTTPPKKHSSRLCATVPTHPRGNNLPPWKHKGLVTQSKTCKHEGTCGLFVVMCVLHNTFSLTMRRARALRFVATFHFISFHFISFHMTLPAGKNSEIKPAACPISQQLEIWSGRMVGRLIVQEGTQAQIK